MFSHWQGRLDPRAMILGRTRKGAKVGKGLSEDARGLVLRNDGRPQRGAATFLPANPQTAENEIEGTMKVGTLPINSCQKYLFNIKHLCTMMT